MVIMLNLCSKSNPKVVNVVWKEYLQNRENI